MEKIIEKIEENKKSKDLYFYINNYDIETLPGKIGELSHLTVLDLTHNSLKSLPKEIGNLKNLVILDLSNNKISELPKEISFLKKLEHLILNNNNVLELPIEIVNLTALKRIEIGGNPIVTPPIEICTRGIHAITNYFNSLEKSRENIQLFEAKLLIVGEGNVGKTRIMNYILSKSEIPRSKESLSRLLKFKSKKIELPTTTEGIDIQKWFFKFEQKQFRINIWDFGGQEIYHATHQFFLTKRSLYLFVWNARTDDSLISFDYWLNVIRLIGSEAPVLIVQNKIDERVKNIDEHLISDSFSNIQGFHKVSASVGTSMNELINQIKIEVSTLPHIGDKLPKVWNDIRLRLESLNQNFITHDEYLNICSEFQTDSKQADFISQYYHDIGVFLHFQDSSVLNDIIFLKPEWATNAVYKLIDTHEIIINYGKFCYSNLQQYWSDYPTNNYIHLIELMKKFELCFELPGTNNFIIPELLSSERPHFFWDDTENLSIRFSYDFMPKGIITRFIVRNHDLISGNLFWKNGLLLKLENTQAVILSDDFKRIIEVKVRGYDKNALLSIILREIDLIHKTLNYPTVTKLVPCFCSVCTTSSNPYYFDYETLKRYKEKNKKYILCPKSIIDIDIDQLTIGINKTAIKGSKEGLFLVERLRKCLYGNKGWVEYEEICQDIIKYLFEDDFTLYITKEQSVTHDNINRRDLIINNNFAISSSFWGRMADQYKSRLITFEFKNYTEKISENELVTTLKYLNPKIGLFAIIISRKGLDSGAILRQRRYLSDDKLLLSIKDKDLIEMIDLKMRGKDPKEILEELLFSILKYE